MLLGNEIYLSEEGLTEAEMDGHHPCHFWHLILIAKDATGFFQLKQLSSAAWRRAWFRNILRTPTYPSDLFKYAVGGHLVCSTACLGGYAAWCWKNYNITINGNGFINAPEDYHDADYYLNKLDNHLAAMENLFGKGNFYIELQPNELLSEQMSIMSL